MRGRISWLLSASLLAAATATTAQPLPCASVAAEVREYVKSRGACRDVKPAPRPRATRPAAKASDSQPSTQQKLALPQEPASAAVAPSDGTAIPPTADSLPAGAERTTPATAPVTPTAVSPAQAPAADPAPASTVAPPEPLRESTVPPVARSQLPSASSASAAFIFVAGVSLGLLFGAISMRQWLLRRRPIGTETAPAPALSQRRPPADRQPAESAAAAAPQTGGADEIRFAAWFVPLQTTIELAPRAGGVPIEHSRDHHA